MMLYMHINFLETLRLNAKRYQGSVTEMQKRVLITVVPYSVSPVYYDEQWTACDIDVTYYVAISLLGMTRNCSN